MENRQVAVINESDNLTPSEVAKATAAVQKQVTRDFGPLWGVTAVVSVFPSLEDMPLGYWPVVIRDEIGINEPGAHVSEVGEKPFALVLFTGKNWTITLSHEVLEMLVDPFGKLLLTGPSVRDDESTVEYLAEICDPCQSDGCAYRVNGDQRVSDFVVPAFYKGFGPGRYSFAGHVPAARQVLADGYLTWHDPLLDEWWQAFDQGTGPQFRQLNPDLLRPDVHLRGAVDRDTTAFLAQRKKYARKPRRGQPPKRQRQRLEQYAALTQAQAAWWQRQFARISQPGTRKGTARARDK